MSICILVAKIRCIKVTKNKQICKILVPAIISLTNKGLVLISVFCASIELKFGSPFFLFFFSFLNRHKGRTTSS